MIDKSFIVRKFNKLLPLYTFLKYGATGSLDEWPLKSLVKASMRYYQKKMGYSFDINNPQLFTEKIQWYKFFYERDDFAQIVDKVLFKEYIANRLGEGYTIPMYGYWDNIKSLENEWFERGGVLPEKFVLKANLQSDGRNIKIIEKKSETDFNSIKAELELWLKVENTLMNSFDRRFYTSKPMILAEEYMSNFENQLYDYKFFCFNGEPYCMYVATEHFDETGRNKDTYPIMFYDLNWQKMDVRYGGHSNSVDVPKPVHYDEMVDLAKKLSMGFPFIRVDFFDTEEKVYLAELTFNPGGGYVPYYPETFNAKLGEMFELPKQS